jgi:hypothetical protein
MDIFELKLYSFVTGAAVTEGVFHIARGYVDPGNAFNVGWTDALMLVTVLRGMRDRSQEQ